jgi:hypothetical protein
MSKKAFDKIAAGLNQAVGYAQAKNESAWQPIETAPKDGTPFLAVIIDIVDEYDEHDRLIAKAKREVHIGVAQQMEFLGGPIEIPYSGSIVRGRRFTHWQPLPAPPASERDMEAGR